MKKITNYISMGLLLVAMVFVLAACNDGVASLAAPDEDGLVIIGDVEPDDYDIYEEFDFDAADNWFDNDNTPTFGQVTGTVTAIDDGVITIATEESTAVLIADFNTLILGESLEVGQTVTGYFFLDMPMAMIYPPQHSVAVIVNNDTAQDDGIPFVHVCRFFSQGNDQLISGDGELVINLGGDTEVILQSGGAFEGDFAGRMLVVTYAMSTRSLPPQTTPIQIVVLYERISFGPEAIELPDDWNHEDVDLHYDIIIDGEGLVGAHALFLDEEMDHQTHVELVPVAAHLGATVVWNEDNTIAIEGLDRDITFTVGSNDFTVNGETITLFHGSVDFYGTVYVPVLFFQDVFGMGSAYAFEGRIYINTDADDME